MYVPPFNSLDEASSRALAAETGSGELITVGHDGFPLATLLPIMWRDDVVIAHMARANPHWRQIDPGSPALLVITAAQAYISPSWYAAKAEHGRVVPTWNYLSVHLTGTVRVHDDPEWVRGAVTDLTDLHESPREPRWHVADAPAQFVEAQLRGIVGIELTVVRVEGKAKLGQNRSVADRVGMIGGLRADGTPRALDIAARASATLEQAAR